MTIAVLVEMLGNSKPLCKAHIGNPKSYIKPQARKPKDENYCTEILKLKTPVDNAPLLIKIADQLIC
jgi:hypothetical protein